MNGTETISGEFNSQEEANKGEKPRERVMGQLERRAEKISGQFDSTRCDNGEMGRKPGSV